MNINEWFTSGEPKEIDLGFIKVSFTPTPEKLTGLPTGFAEAQAAFKESLETFKEQAAQRQKEAVAASYQFLKDGLEIFKNAAEDKGIEL